MISIVITAFNEEQYIRDCLEAFTRLRVDEPWELIAVDNSSTDSTARIIKEYATLLPLTYLFVEQKGRGAAKHYGFRAARGQIILSTDADTVVPPDWATLYLRFFKEHPKVIAVGGLCKTGDFSPLKNAILNLGWILARWIYRMFRGRYYIAASNSAIRRTAYTEAGEYKKDCYGSEEIELCTRLARIDEIGFAPHIVVTTSGRRFKDGILRGVMQYWRVFISTFLLKNTLAQLTNVR